MVSLPRTRLGPHEVVAPLGVEGHVVGLGLDVVDHALAAGAGQLAAGALGAVAAPVVLVP